MSTHVVDQLANTATPAAHEPPRTCFDRYFKLLGWAATTTAVLMYVSYVDQIRLNLSGQTGSIIQPIATVINCTLWVSYGWFGEKCDWPIILGNAPGIVLGAAVLATAL